LGIEDRKINRKKLNSPRYPKPSRYVGVVASDKMEPPWAPPPKHILGKFGRGKPHPWDENVENENRLHLIVRHFV
jgi:hypothetical protein